MENIECQCCEADITEETIIVISGNDIFCEICYEEVAKEIAAKRNREI